MESYSLSASRRAHLRARLSETQQRVFEAYIKARVNALMNLHGNQLPIGWTVTALKIDDAWEQHKRGEERQHALFCSCGRPIKYQFELKQSTPKPSQLVLGSTHLADFAGWPVNQAFELQREAARATRELDEVLKKFDRGARFPEARFGYLCVSSGLDGSAGFQQRIQRFRDANLPLLEWDANHLAKLAAEHPHRQPSLAGSAKTLTAVSAVVPSGPTMADPKDLARFKSHLEAIMLEAMAVRSRPELVAYTRVNLEVAHHIRNLTHVSSAKVRQKSEEKWQALFLAMTEHKPRFEISDEAIRALFHLEALLWEPQLEQRNLQRNTIQALLERMTTLTALGDDHITELANKRIVNLVALLRDRPSLLRLVWVKDRIKQLYLQLLSVYRPVGMKRCITRVNALTVELKLTLAMNDTANPES